jgi:hypothetical protein
MGIHRYIATDPVDIAGFRADLFRACEADENLRVIATPLDSKHDVGVVDLDARFFTLWIQSVSPHTDDFLVIAQDDITREWVHITIKDGRVVIEVMSA